MCHTMSLLTSEPGHCQPARCHCHLGQVDPVNLLAELLKTCGPPMFKSLEIFERCQDNGSGMIKAGEHEKY